MKEQLGEEELELCHLLALALHGEREAETGSKLDWSRLVTIAGQHKVLSFLYDILADVPLGEPQRKQVEASGQRAAQQSYHLLFLSKYIVNVLKEGGVDAILLKGCGTAALYPVPELRKSGDIDLLLRGEEAAQRAFEILKESGFRMEENQSAHHHLACRSADGIEVELHTALAEAFDNERTNAYLRQRQKDFFTHRQKVMVMGVEFELPTAPYHAFYLLLHMLHHFLRSGFGLKLLCDWVVFWEQELTEEDQRTFLELVRGSGIENFARTVTEVCVQYLGLSKERVRFLLCGQRTEELSALFLAEILEAEEFGKSQADRMVVLRGTKIWDYAREFHHQMHLAYPKAGRYVVLYPLLWIATLCGFVYRNRSMRGVSGIEILKKAGKRSKLMEQMKLFEWT